MHIFTHRHIFHVWVCHLPYFICFKFKAVALILGKRQPRCPSITNHSEEDYDYPKKGFGLKMLGTPKIWRDISSLFFMSNQIVINRGKPHIFWQVMTNLYWLMLYHVIYIYILYISICVSPFDGQIQLIHSTCQWTWIPSPITFFKVHIVATLW